MNPLFNQEPWHLNFKGVASTPDWEIRAGHDFKSSLTGPVICTFPFANSRTAEQITANAKLVVVSPQLYRIAVAYRNHLRTAAHSEGEVATFQHIETILRSIPTE